MLKYIGIILFSCSVSAYGAYLSHNISTASKIRHELLSFTKHIENEIKYKNAPLCHAFKVFSSPTLYRYGFLEGIYNNGDYKGVVEETLFLLTKKERALICDMLYSLGKSHFSDKELSTLIYFRQGLEDIFEDSEKIGKERSLLYKKLGLIAALISAIILI